MEVLRAGEAAVVLIDWQEKLAGAMEPALEAERRRRAAALLGGAQALGLPILATEQYPRGLGPTVPELAALLGRSPWEKRAFACTDVPPFVEALGATGRRQVLLAGMEAHICVLQTARGLVSLGYDVRICRDAAMSRRPDDFEVALESWREVGARVTSVEAALFEMLGCAEGEAWKSISRLVR
jgi:nicotinamidase-related amidase